MLIGSVSSSTKPPRRPSCNEGRAFVGWSIMQPGRARTCFGPARSQIHRNRINASPAAAVGPPLLFWRACTCVQARGAGAGGRKETQQAAGQKAWQWRANPSKMPVLGVLYWGRTCTGVGPRLLDLSTPSTGTHAPHPIFRGPDLYKLPVLN